MSTDNVIDITIAQQRQAIVAGEALQNWPQDLYIPPEALEVFLETFQGPLDLLLYLIRKQNIDILDIPVAEITRQYMEYVDLMRQLKLDLAAEYLVMAATLAEIKSRLLLPRPQEEDEEGQDPRAALVRRLQTYERFRQAAIDMDALPRMERDIFVVRAEFEAPELEVRLPEVNIDDLFAAFNNVIELAAHNRHLIVGREELSVRERMTDILDKLHSKKFLRFEELFNMNEGRMGLVVSFVAILELVKENVLAVVQNEPFAPIHVKAVIE